MINYPLLFCTTNMNECVNKVLKYILFKKR